MSSEGSCNADLQWQTLKATQMFRLIWAEAHIRKRSYRNLFQGVNHLISRQFPEFANAIFGRIRRIFLGQNKKKTCYKHILWNQEKKRLVLNHNLPYLKNTKSTEGESNIQILGYVIRIITRSHDSSHAILLVTSSSAQHYLRILTQNHFPVESSLSLPPSSLSCLLIASRNSKSWLSLLKGPDTYRTIYFIRSCPMEDYLESLLHIKLCGLIACLLWNCFHVLKYFAS